jgi:hypothetical protein
VSFGGGGGLGLKREDDYPSFSTAIRATKNIKKIHTVAVDGHQMMKRHTTTNQKTVSVMGGGIMTNWDRGGTYRGDNFPSLVRRIMRQKIKRIKMIVALGSRQTMNSTQQPTKNKQA